jgi:molecular chaperone DnaK
MRQEAEVYAEADRERKALVEMKNQADALFYTYETTMRDNSELISEELKAQAIERVTALKAAIADPTITKEEMKHKLDALQQTLLDIGASVYKRSAEAEDSFSYLDDDDDPDSTAAYNLGGRPNLDPDDDDATITADYEAVD